MPHKKLVEDGRKLRPLTGTRALETRQRIQVTKILNVLAQHVAGDRPMTATQVSAAKLLLDKSLPDLQSITLRGDDSAPVAITITSDDAQVL